jgi:MHS family proline/betaine transporter-like MFS transporter
MLSFAVFASSYLARPIGSVFFGILGDRYGTASALKVSMLGMSIPAALIAFLPTYQTAGYLATGLLLVLKMIQGFCAGGEMPLSGYFVSLNTANKDRGLYCALVVVSGFLGMMLASATIFCLRDYTDITSRSSTRVVAEFLIEPWRWPFLLCIPLSVLIYLMRSSIYVKPAHPINRASSVRPALPLIQAFILVAFMEIVIYSIFIWMPSYLINYLEVTSFDANLSNVITLVIFSMSMVGVGYAARFIDPSKFVFIGAASLACSSYPLFEILQSGDFFTLMLVQAAFAIMAGCMVGVIFIVLPDLFKNNWGSFGMASTYSIATAIFGGTAPMVCAYLIEMTHVVTAPSFYIFATGLLATPVAYGISRAKRNQKPRTSGDDAGRLLATNTNR